MNISNHGPVRRLARGFTLIELLVVMAIVAILASFAYSGYRSQVVKTQRGAAKACLAQYAAFMERRYTTSMSYAGATPALDCAIEGNMPQNYTFTVAAPTATTFTVTAQRTAAFASRDTQCGNLTLNQAGERNVSTGNAAECW